MDFDEIKTNFVKGLVKPLLDLVGSIFVYAITSIVKTFATLETNSFSKILLSFDVGTLVIVYVIISLIHDIVDGFRKGYNEPSLGIVQSLGAVVGTTLFWNALVSSYSVAGGTKIDALSTSLIMIFTTIGGIILQKYIHSHK